MSKQAQDAVKVPALVRASAPETVAARPEELAESGGYGIADLRSASGLRVEFTYDPVLNEYGMVRQARAEGDARLTRGDFGTPLEAYLLIAPGSLPIPEELLELKTGRARFAAEIEKRGIATASVIARDLDLSAPAPAPTAAVGGTCTSTHFPWRSWHDGLPGLAPASYYSSTFGGRCWRADSFIRNCIRADAGDFLWARHRMFYKNFGKYVQQFEGKVPPGEEQEKTLWGWSKRFRRVSYDDGWDSHPNNPELRYTREGRFPDL